MKKRKSQSTLPFFFILLYHKCLSHLSAFREMLIESNDRLDAFVEVVEAIVLVGAVDGVFAETEAHQDGLDAQHFLESGDNRDGAARTHRDGQLAVGFHVGRFGGFVGRQVDGASVGLTAMQRCDLHGDILGCVLLKVVLH